MKLTVANCFQWKVEKERGSIRLIQPIDLFFYHSNNNNNSNNSHFNIFICAIKTPFIFPQYSIEHQGFLLQSMTGTWTWTYMYMYRYIIVHTHTHTRMYCKEISIFLDFPQGFNSIINIFDWPLKLKTVKLLRKVIASGIWSTWFPCLCVSYKHCLIMI